MMTNLLIVVLCICVTCNTLADIRNGYEPQLNNTITALQSLKLKLYRDKDLSATERRMISRKVEELENIIAYHELTEAVIRQLKRISPDIYGDVYNIKDRKGRTTDIYVRLIPQHESRVQLSAASFLKRSLGDEDACRSEFGDYSVSIDIWISDTALLQLSHELGHVSYIIPNMSAYSIFYAKHYPKAKVNMGSIGHHGRDLSGKMANAFEKRFRTDRSIYLHHVSKPESVYSLLKGIRKDIDSINPLGDPALASNNAL